MNAIHALSQLSYVPEHFYQCSKREYTKGNLQRQIGKININLGFAPVP
jgi:hypothetical protein